MAHPSAVSRHLAAQASQIKQYLADGLDVFAYFNNDMHGYAGHSAADLKLFCS